MSLLRHNQGRLFPALAIAHAVSPYLNSVLSMEGGRLLSHSGVGYAKRCCQRRYRDHGTPNVTTRYDTKCQCLMCARNYTNSSFETA